MTLEIIGHTYAYEMECVVRLFYPGERIEIACEPDQRHERRLTTAMEKKGETIALFVAVQVEGQAHEGYDSFAPGEDWEWEAQRRLGLLLFDGLCAATDLRPPWGILTGVRPVNLCRKMLSRYGFSESQLAASLTENYQVLPQKAKLAISVLGAQKSVLEKDGLSCYSLYVNIPFCPTRCMYCSFVSHAIDRAAGLLPDYLGLLGQELSVLGEAAKSLGFELRSVYIGGGTPTALCAEQLRELLAGIEKSFPTQEVLEYTVEAGRPDCTTKEKLEVLKSFGVTRISVNPQTMDDTILEEIGRGHTAAQTVECMSVAREVGFESINMDLIAGLPGQSMDSFCASLEEILALRPENITVHTITVKRASDLRTSANAFEKTVPTAGMVELANARLSQVGYRPYYLYRQQGSPHNLENTGYCLPGKEGIYNIYSMEDAHTIFAAGAGGVTKLCGLGGKVVRLRNYKYPYEYISGHETMLERKRAVAKFFER
ncbi:MAG: coproporphyrinogen dehydrogenase HemZ [Oscillospiraceae bacterium]|nr:coproporphyrinogen dehydrogenase HemZ [Oscillospiraceae bacterium]